MGSAATAAAAGGAGSGAGSDVNYDPADNLRVLGVAEKYEKVLNGGPALSTRTAASASDTLARSHTHEWLAVYYDVGYETDDSFIDDAEVLDQQQVFDATQQRTKTTGFYALRHGESIDIDRLVGGGVWWVAHEVYTDLTVFFLPVMLAVMMMVVA